MEEDELRRRDIIAGAKVVLLPNEFCHCFRWSRGVALGGKVCCRASKYVVVVAVFAVAVEVADEESRSNGVLPAGVMDGRGNVFAEMGNVDVASTLLLSKHGFSCSLERVAVARASIVVVVVVGEVEQEESPSASVIVMPDKGFLREGRDDVRDISVESEPLFKAAGLCFACAVTGEEAGLLDNDCLVVLAVDP